MPKKREIPPQVIAAKLRGDTEALRAMSKAGNRKKRALKKAAEAADRAVSERIEAILAEDHERSLRADAYAHHLRNWAGVSQD